MDSANSTRDAAEKSKAEIPSYVEVYHEPLHPTTFENGYVLVMRVSCPNEQETLYHRHSHDSFFLFFADVKVRNNIVGKDPFEIELDRGSFFWGDYLHNPMIHKVQVVGGCVLDCMVVEIKNNRPTPSITREALPDTDCREKCFENDMLRVYRVKLPTGEHIAGREAGSSLGFPCLLVMITEGTLSRGSMKAGQHWWSDGSVKSEGQEVNNGEQKVEIMILEPK